MLNFDIAAAQIDGARDYQEDAFLVTYLGERATQNGSLLIVADGMGGHAAGNVASNMAVQTFNREVVTHFPCDDMPGILRGAVDQANQSIQETVRETQALKGMGCTFVAVVIDDDEVYWVSVGDSHLYLVRDGELFKLNADHSYGGFLDRMAAQGTPVEAEAGFSRNMLMSALTGEPIAEVDCPPTPVQVQAGDRLVIASDGLDTLSSDQIIACCDMARSARETVDDLLDNVQSARRPKQDNTSVVVLAVTPSEDDEAEEDAVPAGAAVFTSSAPEPVAAAKTGISTVPRGIETEGSAIRYSARPKPKSQRRAQPLGATAKPKSKRRSSWVVVAAGVLVLALGSALMLRPTETTTPSPVRQSDQVAYVEGDASPEPTPGAEAPPATIEAIVVDPAPQFRDAAGNTPLPLMAALPAGRFTMGSPSASVYFDEQPQRNVEIQPFGIGVYEVTVAEFSAFANATGRAYQPPTRTNPATTPATMVSFADARAYTEWLSQVTGARYRLPTEAEWEYAARAGTTTLYSWGRELTPGKAHCIACENNLDPRIPTAVGAFAANPFGLFDMVGNVQEWTADCYAANYENAPTDGSAFETANCGERVARGGAFISGPKGVRSAAREALSADTRNDVTGFRVVREQAE